MLGADQRLVLDAVRLERVRAARLLHPIRVLRPRSLKPGHLTIALERKDVRCDSVEEPAVVGDHYGTAGEVEQCLFEGTQRIHVEVD